MQVFTSTSTIVVKTFPCDLEAVDGEEYLRADYSISCDSTTHKWFEAYAAIMILVSMPSTCTDDTGCIYTQMPLPFLNRHPCDCRQQAANRPACASSAPCDPADVALPLRTQVYPVGIPVLYAYILWKHRESLNPRVQTDGDERPGASSGPAFSLLKKTEYLTKETAEELHERLEKRKQNPDLVPSMFLWKDFGEEPT